MATPRGGTSWNSRAMRTGLAEGPAPQGGPHRAETGRHHPLACAGPSGLEGAGKGARATWLTSRVPSRWAGAGPGDTISPSRGAPTGAAGCGAPGPGPRDQRLPPGLEPVSAHPAAAGPQAALCAPGAAPGREPPGGWLCCRTAGCPGHRAQPDSPRPLFQSPGT